MDQISERVMRVMPTRAFCSFNPEWDISHQETPETETWYFSPLSLSHSKTILSVFYLLTCWE